MTCPICSGTGMVLLPHPLQGHLRPTSCSCVPTPESVTTSTAAWINGEEYTMVTLPAAPTPGPEELKFRAWYAREQEVHGLRGCHMTPACVLEDSPAPSREAFFAAANEIQEALATGACEPWSDLTPCEAPATPDNPVSTTPPGSP